MNVWKCVLAFRHQDKARSRLNSDSSSFLSIMSAIMKLCLSTRPLLNGDSAAVTLPHCQLRISQEHHKFGSNF